MNAVRLGNQEFEGHNNAYLLPAGDSVALVDTGIASEPVREALVDGLADIGYEVADVETIVVTHWHQDHAGIVGDLQAESGATVHVHEADAPLVRQDEDALAAFEARQRERFEQWAIPTAKREELAVALETDHMTGRAPTVDSLTDGDTITVGDRTLETIHAPGHSAGLCAFAFEGDSGTEAFLGDAVLPVYTPNVGGADVRLDGALAKYLDTLSCLAEWDFARGWPGHRDPIEDTTARAREIIEHHRERTALILDILEGENDALDPWTVSAHLFGDLEGIHVIHGPGEAFAHLEHLERHTPVESGQDGYRLVGDRPAIDALF